MACSINFFNLFHYVERHGVNDVANNDNVKHFNRKLCDH